MPLAGVHRIIVGELTQKKKKGKELSNAQWEALKPESVKRKNDEMKSAKK